MQVIKTMASSKHYHGASLLASQPNGFVQQLGHLLVVGVVLPPWPAGNEAIVLQLGHVLLRESLHTCVAYTEQQGTLDGVKGLAMCATGGGSGGKGPE